MKMMTVQLIAAPSNSDDKLFQNLEILDVRPSRWNKVLSNIDKDFAKFGYARGPSLNALDGLSNVYMWNRIIEGISPPDGLENSEYILAAINYIFDITKSDAKIVKLLKKLQKIFENFQIEKFGDNKKFFDSPKKITSRVNSIIKSSINDLNKIKKEFNLYKKNYKATTDYLEKIWLPSMGFKLKYNVKNQAYILSQPFTKRISSSLLKLGFKPQKGKNPFWNPTGEPEDEGYYFRDSNGVDFAFIENKEGKWLLHVV